MKYLTVITAFLLCSNLLYAQTFEEYKQRQDAAYNAYKAKSDSLFNQYVKDEQERFDIYRGVAKPSPKIEKQVERLEKLYPKEVKFITNKEIEKRIKLAGQQIKSHKPQAITPEEKAENEKEDDLLTAQLARKKADDTELKKEMEANRPVMFPLPKGSFRVSSSFSKSRMHPVLKVRRPHNGIDLAAPTGTKIYAPASGKVLKSYHSKSGGHITIIDHNNGYSTTYMHQNKRNVKTGDKVKRGDIIGTVGSTGHSTGAHLHYEIRKANKAFDPAGFMITYFE